MRPILIPVAILGLGCVSFLLFYTLLTNLILLYVHFTAFWANLTKYIWNSIEIISKLRIIDFGFDFLIFIYICSASAVADYDGILTEANLYLTDEVLKPFVFYNFCRFSMGIKWNKKIWLYYMSTIGVKYFSPKKVSSNFIGCSREKYVYICIRWKEKTTWKFIRSATTVCGVNQQMFRMTNARIPPEYMQFVIVSFSIAYPNT